MKFVSVFCVLMIASTAFAWQTVGGKLSCLKDSQLRKYTVAVQQGDKKTSDFIVQMQICRQLPANEQVTLLKETDDMYQFMYGEYSMTFWTYKDGLAN